MSAPDVSVIAPSEAIPTRGSIGWDTFALVFGLVVATIVIVGLGPGLFPDHLQVRSGRRLARYGWLAMR